jgi:hypothetical protein
VRVDGETLEVEVEIDDRSSVWTGIAGKFTPSRAFSIGGPNDVGLAVITALSDPSSSSGKAIRE